MMLMETNERALWPPYLAFDFNCPSVRQMFQKVILFCLIINWWNQCRTHATTCLEHAGFCDLAVQSSGCLTGSRLTSLIQISAVSLFFSSSSHVCVCFPPVRQLLSTVQKPDRVIGEGCLAVEMVTFWHGWSLQSFLPYTHHEKVLGSETKLLWTFTCSVFIIKSWESTFYLVPFSNVFGYGCFLSLF